MAKNRGYTPEYYGPKPTKSTLFWRSFIPWQMWRFVVLNWKVIRIVVMGHS